MQLYTARAPLHADDDQEDDGGHHPAGDHARLGACSIV